LLRTVKVVEEGPSAVSLSLLLAIFRFISAY